MDVVSFEDLQHNFGIPHSYFSGNANDEMEVKEAAFYTKYGRIKFRFEGGMVKQYEVLPVDNSFISPV